MPTDAGHGSPNPCEHGRSFRDYAEHVSGVAWVGGIPWSLYGRVLMPLCMPHVPVEVERAELQEAVSRTHALLACWTTRWDSFDASEWWWTVCDHTDYAVENLASSNGRASIRQGLRHCTARLIEAEDFAQLAYPVYKRAAERYGAHVPTQSEHAQNIKRLAEYPGTEFWGAFHDHELAAFASCRMLDGAVELISAKSDPNFHRYEPNATLFYTLAKHYLDLGLGYVSNGSRTLWHPSAINEFLEKLGFRKVFCQVNVQLSMAARAMDRVKIARWGSSCGLDSLLGRRWSQLEGFDKLMRIADTFR